MKLLDAHKGRETTFQENKSLTQKFKICLTISNRNAFSKASYKRSLLGEVYQKTPTMKLT